MAYLLDDHFTFTELGCVLRSRYPPDHFVETMALFSTCVCDVDLHNALTPSSQQRSALAGSNEGMGFNSAPSAWQLKFTDRELVPSVKQRTRLVLSG